MPEANSEQTTASLALVRSQQVGADLDQRLRSVLPDDISVEVFDEEGRLDWRKLGSVQLVRQAGSVAMAYALPELWSDESRTMAQLEEKGDYEGAIAEFEKAQELTKTANLVLSAASDILYRDGGVEGAVLRRKNGEVSNQGATLSQLADVLVVRLQEEVVLPDQASEFISQTVTPVVELVRQGLDAESALAVVDLASQFNYSPNELIEGATAHDFDLTDEADRLQFTNILLQANGDLDNIAVFVELHGEIDVDENLAAPQTVNDRFDAGDEEAFESDEDLRGTGQDLEDEESQDEERTTDDLVVPDDELDDEDVAEADRALQELPKL